MNSNALSLALSTAANRAGFTLAEAAEAGVALPTRPGSAGWAVRWAAVTAAVVEQARQEKQAAEAAAYWAARRAQEAADLAALRAEKAWFVEEVRGVYSFSGDLFDFRPAYRPGRHGKTWEETEQGCEDLRKHNARTIARNRACWDAFING